MTKEEVLLMLDEHKNKLLNPVEMLDWAWLRVLISHITDEEWNVLLQRSLPTLSR